VPWAEVDTNAAGLCGHHVGMDSRNSSLEIVWAHENENVDPEIVVVKNLMSMAVGTTQGFRGLENMKFMTTGEFMGDLVLASCWRL